ncbi:hypothetical protein KM043_010562 [Ampulex compressa]|nr:hypothetical protein KM043_010562 [Ampulex compressa]
MQPNNSTPKEEQGVPRIVQGPLQLPSLVKGEKIKSGPYTTTVTDEMVAQRERENEELYRAWLQEQQRRMLPEGDREDYVGDFKQSAVRRNFVRKVFCILTLQLIFTTCIIALFLFIEEATKFMIVHWYLWIIAMIFFIISYCAVSYSIYARRTPPCNYICLCILTLAMAYLTAFASVFYSVETILLAMGMTTLIALIIGCAATFCKFDMTMRPGLLMIAGLVAIVAILTMTIVLIFTHIKVLQLIIAVIGTLLLSMYLYFDIQTIMGGRRIELNPDEVVFACVQIYVDVVLLYQYVLMFMGFVHDG